MEVLGRQVYRFDGVEVDPSQGCLRRGGEELHVRQKSLRALLYLLEQRHRLVSKEELIERVWEGAAVTDDALVQVVTELRRNLGDDPRRPRFIKTVPKAGYRFIAPVEELFFSLPDSIELERHASVEIEFEEEISGEAEGYTETGARRQALPGRTGASKRRRAVMAAAVAVALLAAGSLAAYLTTRPRRHSEQLADVTLTQLPGKRTLAVMFFENSSNSPEMDWLREGLADMLITDLSRSERLTVLSRQELYLLLGRIGHKPGGNIRLDEALAAARRSRAEAIITGSFAHLDGKVRVDAQLHDARSGRLLAAEHFVTDRPHQILTQIDLLSLKLASHLGATPAERDRSSGLADVMTNNLEAYRHYSLALEKAQALHNKEAIALLEKSVALDPQFAMAHARIGYVYAVTWGLADKGKPHLEKAYRLSERLTEKDRLHINAWYAIANLDYPGAARTLRQLIAQHPLEVEAYWRLGRLLLGEEQYEEAIDVLKRGLVVDAEAKDVYNALGVTYRDIGRHDEAIAMSERYVQLAPDEPNARDSLALAYQGAGLYEQALEEYRLALHLNPEFEVALLHLGNLYFQLGRYREAIRHYERYIRMASSDWDRAWGYGRIAWVHRRKGDIERAALAARKEMNYEKSSIGSSLLVALERGDRATVERLEGQLFAQGPYTERGLRPALRSVYYFRGHVALKSGRAAEAVENFKEVLKHRPLIWDIDSFEDCLANAHLELGQVDEAIAEYERILRLNPNYPLAHYHLARAYERKGLPERARISYERFLQVWKDADADLPEVVAARERLSK
jgi:tetratricopeptide (TPR) repeat protein/DNA-binding winged helix-turn-helix (wHTH) protein